MTETSPPRPALRTLQEQQAELVDHDRDAMTGLDCSLRPGFESRRELIRWYQSATVRTFGALGKRWPPLRMQSDRTLLQACIVSSRRTVWASGRPLDLDAAESHRRMIEEHALLPAMHQAYNTLRRMAGEYIGEDGDRSGDFDAAQQEIAMRPAFSRKDLEQRRALQQLWGGFESKDNLRTWLHGLDQPTNGGLEDDWVPRVMSDQVAVDHLIAGRVEPRKARSYREGLAISKLLPAFRKGIMRMDAGELAKHTRSELEVAQA